MQTGLYISSVGHGALIIAAMIGGIFSTPESPPPDVTEVTLITAAELDAFAAIKPDVLTDVTPLSPTPPHEPRF